MCGFVGFWHLQKEPPIAMNEIARQMSERIAHRGPDAWGRWRDDDVPLIISHQRLSIRDLSVRGAQPMLSHSSRWVMAYNGEIYNTRGLSEALATRGVILKGHSDTEALLNSIAVFGLQDTLTKINGMFAFSLWDRLEKKLYLVRDRLGIKPLYWGFNRGVLYFGSQLKAFTAHPDWQSDVDYSALANYFRLNYIAEPYTIYKGIYKLQPGHVITIDRDGRVENKVFWSLLEKANAPKLKTEDVKEHVEELHALLKDAVKCRLVSDVPLGAFLSGGVDSSTVVALMQTQHSAPIKTFTIGFHEDHYNEAKYAKAVAQYLGTDHEEWYLSVNDATALIPELPQWYDEPFADSSQLPTLLVSKLARQKVIVSLSGDGGDELFAGYNRYFLTRKLLRRVAILPHSMRSLLSKIILSIKPEMWEHVGKIIPEKIRPSMVGDKAHKLANVLRQDQHKLYLSLVSAWDAPTDVIQRESQEYAWPEVVEEDFIFKMQLLDALTYLPGDILTKVDRASMAVGLEARVPLLDYRVVEFALRLPMQEKIVKNEGKWILRQVLKKYIPDPLINRPKMGFGVPIKTWLRTSLKDWAHDLLSTEKLTQAQLNVELIQTRWRQHQSGVRNWESSLWSVLMYQAWRESI
ncbi:MAG: asparagine synthase (glutamine-hydrolyzing) [Coxiella sp. RIFCSPHIGHO2_12_FULL_44_14]|nr:MAG: asparagine synthase (glutamine-hydrolyzing) [Coxiella sp. RIFCSPHIGHO2_12_FULL_44_14]